MNQGDPIFVPVNLSRSCAMVRIAHFKDAEDLVEIRKVEYDLAPIRGEELKAMASS